ncbi:MULTISPECIES: LLM class F420-dependent oxidoreductase [Gordonia]|uniref:LLM class F420-dependent oxidoreductase n=2 Tax=Gordonia terrae TaxID=2055 RepID=A0A2I1R2B8_9ACTN|nr:MULTISPECIES: LLM class F420-dependent oxidoreductase [Gordonia]VTR08957.1 F420-dependent glucose-6-phosphate dehydrogenase [Clostridioides difficile]ANY21681.1 F420-dependent oxidoreductase [Gordonia terrae]AWO82411.1 LLM class F420-dependent oxidoreductase [Gordonia terrae]MCG7635632.1 LLM class F420-dependent oxidoreductase [Gordonia sp. McavH-238-E]PKZ63267.1 TIGR03621 family F420-dependent LLM class oxidoreductase [Gordonia terrae]
MTQPPSDAGGASSGLRKFRFGAGGEGNKDEGGARKFVKLAQTAEEYGYDTFAVPDHLGNQVGPLAALGALTQATSTIRLATSVLANGWRHPALLAKEANTIDVLSKGRLELGIGAGWMKEEFDKAGIEFESPGVRIRRLDEALTVLDGLMRGETVNFDGEFYQINGLEGSPRPRQGPRPPIAVGGGGPKMLALAAKHADIISVAPGTTTDGKMKLSDMTIAKTTERVDRIREAAGDRFDDLELNWTIAVIVITDDRVATAEMALKALEQGYPPNIAHDTEFTVDDVLTSPYIAIGSFDEIADQIREVRRRTTMSYVGVFPTQMDAFAPVLAQLKGE